MRHDSNYVQSVMHFLIFVNKNNMYKGLLHAHSGLRWIVLILIVAAIFNALTAKGRTEYSKKDRLLNLFAMVSMHLQVLIGVILSFTTEKVFYHEGWMKSSASMQLAAS